MMGIDGVIQTDLNYARYGMGPYTRYTGTGLYTRYVWGHITLGIGLYTRYVVGMGLYTRYTGTGLYTRYRAIY